jgi:hypothetical protein
VWELESRAWRRHQPTITVEADADIMFYFCFQGHSRHGGTCCSARPGRK